MQIQRVNCCTATNGKKQSFKGFTDRAIERILDGNWSTAQKLCLREMKFKSLVDFQDGRFYVLGKNREINSKASAPFDYDKLRELIGNSTTGILV